jgi:hypothetical protein
VGTRGNIVLALLFALLLAASGLTLLTHTGYHLKIVAARRDKRLEAAALEQALLLGLHRFREKLAVSDMNAYAAPESDFFNNATFPDLEEEGMLSRHRFSSLPLAEADGFRRTRILDHVRTGRRGNGLAYAGRCAVDLIAGSVPVGEAGLLVARPGAGPAAAYLAERGVEYGGAQLPLVGDYALQVETGRLLCSALGLPVEVPDWRRIREKFHLEPSGAPIPPGVYLAGDEGEVTAVFVEGDLQKLELNAGDGWQSITFFRDGRREELRYQPGQASLFWSGGGDFSGALFREKIIVHGSVWDIEQTGAAAFLAASRIELLASGRLVIRSGLEGESLATGKEKLPGLLLMSSDRDFFSGEAVEADVVVAVVGEALIQAQVIAAGKLANGEGSVEITGGLFARDIENGGRLRTAGAGNGFAFAAGVRLADFKLLKNFRVHFIEEASDEE